MFSVNTGYAQDKVKADNSVKLQFDSTGEEITVDSEDATKMPKQGKKKKRHRQHLQVAVGSFFNSQDLFVGGKLGFFVFPASYISFNCFFYGRPFKKTRFEKEDDHYYYQLQENRYLTGFTVEKYFPVNYSFGIFAAAGGAYTFGDPAGTTYDTYSGFTPVAKAGVIIKTPLLIKFGYQFHNIPQLPENNLTCEFTWVY